MVAQKTCLRKSNNSSVLGGDKRSLQTTLSRKLAQLVAIFYLNNPRSAGGIKY